MGKHFDILVDGEFQRSFIGSKEQDARDFFYEVAENNPKKLVKLVMHLRREVIVSKAKLGRS